MSCICNGYQICLFKKKKKINRKRGIFLFYFRFFSIFFKMLFYFLSINCMELAKLVLLVSMVYTRGAQPVPYSSNQQCFHEFSIWVRLNTCQGMVELPATGYRMLSQLNTPQVPTVDTCHKQPGMEYYYLDAATSLTLASKPLAHDQSLTPVTQLQGAADCISKSYRVNKSKKAT